jgi:uncharacterized protein
MIKKYSAYLVLLFLLTACATGIPNSTSTLEIHDIQGCSHTSPYVGKQVEGIEGVVTHKVPNGFTMQTIKPDDLDCSSEAIFVFTKSYPDVMVADRVSVNGLVEEFADGKVEDHNLSQTEIVQPYYKVIQSSQAMPTPIIFENLEGIIPLEIIENDGMSIFDPKEDGLDFFESVESMLVQVRKGMVVAPRNGYGEITVLPETFIKSNLVSAEGALINTQKDANPEKVMIKLPGTFDQEINAGDRIDQPITGIMDYSYGNYKVLAFSPIEISSSEQIIDTFTSKEGGLTIVTYNLENLSPQDESRRFVEIGKQIVKILQSPDVLVLNEIMDNSGSVDDGVVDSDQTIEKLVNSIIKAGGPTYSYSNTNPNNNQDGGIEGGNIRTILLFRSDNGISLENEYHKINGIKFQDGLFSIEQNPSLVGEFSATFNGTRKPRIWLLNKNGQQFFVVGVHLTSQGADSPEWGNQQPPLKPEEMQRVEEARVINQQLSKIVTENSTTPIFIAGDMNDMPWSDTISSLAQESFVNTADLNTPTENYSYIFEGNAQQLDYILINKNLASELVQARFIHINSTLDQEDNISDHDPLMIEYRLDQSAP